MADFQFPNFGVPFPYANLPQQLQGSMQYPQPGNPMQYGRWNWTGNNAFGLAPSAWPSLFGSPTPPPMQWQPPWMQGNMPQLQNGQMPQLQMPQRENPGAFVPSPGNSDPGFGAPPSSAAFGNLTDQDKAYLYRMQQQYRQDMRGQPGAHQLYFDLFGSQYSPTQINSLINDTGLNNNMLPSFNVNDYNGPLKGMYQNLVQQNGGTVNPYGTSTSPTYRRTAPSGAVDFRQYFAPGGAGYAG